VGDEKGVPAVWVIDDSVFDPAVNLQHLLEVEPSEDDLGKELFAP
jgi:hypothetical protein